MITGIPTNLPQEKREALGRVGLGGLMAMACFDGEPSAKAVAAMTAIRDHLLQIDLDLAALSPLPPSDLAQQMIAIDEAPQWRARILRGMTLVAMFDGDLSEAHLQFLQDAAEALKVDNAPVEIYRRSMQDNLMRLRLDIARRSFMSDAIKTSFRQEGLQGIAATVKVLLGKEDKAMAARYRELINYPAGSFGRAYADFILLNDFSFPGEVGGPPPPVMHHDCCHVLGGYGTTPNEEGGVVGFQAGFENLDPFDVLMFIMAEFELGIGTSPYIPGEKNLLDPKYIFAGMEHGSHVNTDLITAINPWDYFADPIDDVRQRFNVLPRGKAPEYANQ
ncbi:MAG: TerB family tellurite resistance protein [Cyanobacteria bacterium P01_A01_bin.135]